MKYPKYIYLTFCFLFWPVSLVLSNPYSWVVYLVSGMQMFVSLLCFSKPSSKVKIISLVFLILALLPTFQEISKNSIFKFDPLSYDTQVKKVAQIPSRTLSRVVQNKYMVYLDKFTSNIFLNLDTNNFFFSLHPREMGNTQNINKFSYTALPLFLIGIFSLISKRRKDIFIYFFTSIAFLSIVSNPDRLDFILWPIIFIIIYEGVVLISKKYPKISAIYFFLSLPLILFDFIRIF